MKVLWLVSKDYRGPVLIRGRQVDGTHRVKVAANPGAQDPGLRAGPFQLRIDRAQPGVDHAAPSNTQVPALGCYAYQIDGIGFSRVIVFKVVYLARPIPRPRGHPGRRVWAALQRRPLHAPRVPAGQSCPITTRFRPAHDADVPGISGGRLLGEGPVYPLTATNQSRILFGSRYHGIGPWYAAHVRWGVARGYRGPVLIRGHQLDGNGQMLFQTAVPGPKRPSLRLYPPTPGDTRTSSWAVARIPATGCYAYQIDGLGLSTVIVFHAVTPRGIPPPMQSPSAH